MGVNQIMAKVGYNLTHNKGDEFYTRYESAAEILAVYKDRYKGKRIICPCDTAESSIYKVLNDNKEAWEIKEIVLSDISKCSCLDIDYSNYDICITNPPFSIGTKFLRKLVEANIDYILWEVGIASSNIYYKNDNIYIAYFGKLHKHSWFDTPAGPKKVDIIIVSSFDDGYLYFEDTFDRIKHIDKPVETTTLPDYNLYFMKTGINKNEEYIYLPLTACNYRWFWEHYIYIAQAVPKLGSGEFKRILAKKK